MWWQRIWPGRRRAGSQDEAIVRSYARSLWALAAGIAAGDARIQALADEIDTAAAALNDADPARRPDYSTFVAFEIRLYALMSEAQKERHYWKVRERFEAIAAAQARTWHEAGRPLLAPDGTPLTGAARSESRDADAAALLHSIGRCHILHWSREAHIDGVRRWIVWTVTSGVLLLVVLGGGLYLMLDWLLDPRGYPASSVHVSKTFVIGLVAIGFMGFLGAAMSTIRRLQLAVASEAAAGVSQFDAASMQYGKRTIRLGMISGAVFSLLLYFVFASGAGALVGLDAGLFPDVTEASRAQLAAARLGYDAHAPTSLATAAPKAAPSAGSADRVAPPAGADAAAAAPPASDAAPAHAAEADAAEEIFTFARKPAKAKRATANTAKPPACYPDVGPSCGWFALIAARLGFAGATDFLKMLIWAFIAGFAERLIPDAIDRVVARRQPQAA